MNKKSDFGTRSTLTVSRRKAPPGPNSQIESNSTDFAAKARDLGALRDSVTDAASVGAGLWFSYIFVQLYLFVAIGSVTHKDLFFQSPIKLPFLNIELPLLGFFALGPLLFLIVHGYVLLHFSLLAGKIGAFHTELKIQLRNQSNIREDLRRQLPSNIFVQIISGPREVREGIIGLLLRIVAQFSLVLGPIALMIFFLLQFLPYHHAWITDWHRIALAAELSLLWLLWPSIARGHVVRIRELRSLGSMATAAVSLFITASAITVATFPGENLYAWRSLVQFPVGRDGNGRWAWLSLHQLLLDGDIDLDARMPKSLWSNRLVLPGLDVIDRNRFDTETKLARLSETVSLRKRNLNGAVLIGAVLDKADLTAAQLQEAQLDGAQLSGANLERADLQGAILSFADLRGANLRAADFRGASLFAANLKSSSLGLSNLQMANLTYSYLHGANLYSADLRGASLEGTELQGASLSLADLRGATISHTSIQGASLKDANLQGTLIFNVNRWRSDLSYADIFSVRAFDNYASQLSSAELGDIKNSLHNILLQNNAQSENTKRIESIIKEAEIRLDPDKNHELDARSNTIWERIDSITLPFEKFVEAKAATWRFVGCTSPTPYSARKILKELGFTNEISDIAFAFGARTDAEKRSAYIHISVLANALLSVDCSGAKGLSDNEKTFLIDRPWEEAVKK